MSRLSATPSILKINYSSQHRTRQRMVSYLKLGSCKVILGKKKPNAIIKKRQKIIFIIAAVVLATGFSFVLF